MLERAPRLARHHVRRPLLQQDLVRRRPTLTRRFGTPGPTYGRSRIRHDDSSDTPATMPYCGASRCQPIGAPGGYSLISAIANAWASTSAHCAILTRIGNEKRRQRR